MNGNAYHNPISTYKIKLNFISTISNIKLYLKLFMLRILKITFFCDNWISSISMHLSMCNINIG